MNEDTDTLGQPSPPAYPVMDQQGISHTAELAMIVIGIIAMDALLVYWVVTNTGAIAP